MPKCRQTLLQPTIWFLHILAASGMAQTFHFTDRTAAVSLCTWYAFTLAMWQPCRKREGKPPSGLWHSVGTSPRHQFYHPSARQYTHPLTQPSGHSATQIATLPNTNKLIYLTLLHQHTTIPPRAALAQHPSTFYSLPVTAPITTNIEQQEQIATT